MILEQAKVTFLVKLKEDSNLGINQVDAMVFFFAGGFNLCLRVFTLN
jgi:hypothetical protein